MRGQRHVQAKTIKSFDGEVHSLVIILQPFQRILLLRLTIGLVASGAAVGFRQHRRRQAVHRV
jgi:hypothetical protein